MPEVPLIVPRDKFSIRNVVRPNHDTARGETGEGEALPEEVKGQAQVAAALKKRKRVKEKLPIRIGLPKRKRQESSSQVQDLEKVSILLLACLNFSLFILVIRRGFPALLTDPTRRK